MHKIVKVTIRKGRDGENLMVYPARYRPQEVDRTGLLVAYSGAIGRGQSEEHCILSLVDGVADIYARDPKMEIIPPDEADRLMAQWDKDKGVAEEYLGDPERIQIVIAKKAIGRELSEEDKRAMDPDDDSCMGINKRRCDIRKLVERKGHKISE